MAAAAPTIPRGPPADPACDFAALKAETVGLVQLYSGNVWTDYNEHDPGVTLLEALAYALTELGYRTGFPVADLLADRDGSLARLSSVLYAPTRILPNAPVTILDYRRLLIDRVEGLGNVWLERRPGEPDGLYDVAVYAAPPTPGLPLDHGHRHHHHHRRHEPEWERRVVERTRRAFVRHRALCEDIGRLRLLRPVRTIVHADVEVDPGAAPEPLLAAAVQRLACFLAPEPRRRPFGDLLAEGRSLADILEGPLLAKGWIDPAALGDRPVSLDAAALTAQLLDVPGVLGVDDLRWELPDRPSGVAIDRDEYFSLDAGLDRPHPTIRLVVGGRPLRIDADEVRRRLRHLWREHRRSYRFVAECRQLFPPPRGRWRDLAQYTAASAALPAVYGLGEQGLTADATPERRAQAKQLAGYLALFDRVMVDFLDRLAHLPDLLAADPLDPRPFERRLAEVLPSLAPLLIDGGPCVESFDDRSIFPLDQQERLARFLLALYGESPPTPLAAGEARLAILRELLRRLRPAGGGRGRGLDYLARRRRRHPAGVELRSRIMLGERRRGPKLTIVEHVLLRPRRHPGRLADAMTVTAVVYLPDGGDHAAIEAMIRANTPTHVALQTRFVDREQWVRFRRLYRLWRRALEEGLDEGLDCISAELRRRFAHWREEEG